MDDKIARAITLFSLQRNVDEHDVLGGSTLRSVCVTRYMLYVYLHYNLRLPASKVATMFGRTRVNVLRGVRVLKGWMKYHQDIRDEFMDIIKQIEGCD